MPSAQRIWQLFVWRRPSIFTRHSKQMPIPQSGARGSPVTERRKRVTPAERTAAATLVPRVLKSSAPFTRIEMNHHWHRELQRGV